MGNQASQIVEIRHSLRKWAVTFSVIFLAIAIFWTLFPIINPGGDFGRPEKAALVFGLFWGAWFLASLAWAIHLHAQRWRMTDEGIEQSGFLRVKFQWDEVKKVVIQKTNGYEILSLSIHQDRGKKIDIGDAELSGPAAVSELIEFLQRSPVANRIEIKSISDKQVSAGALQFVWFFAALFVAMMLGDFIKDIFLR
ncbi:hypothetical protein LLG95_18485 [bacterium]|nr:hypothetical protein [bacterium]